MLRIKSTLPVKPFGKALPCCLRLHTALRAEIQVAALYAVAGIRICSRKITPCRRVLATGGIDHRILMYKLQVTAGAYFQVTGTRTN
ncbi:hypothetical protein D3C81_1757780 [compost metagenome]